MSYLPIVRDSSFESDQSSSQAGLLYEKQSSSVPQSVNLPWITPRILSDFTIGLSDGLTVPFALTAGLSALGNGKIVVSAGFAELVAGAISMGIAGYLGAKGERDAERSSRRATQRLTAADPEEALVTLRVKLEMFALPEEILNSITSYYSLVPSENLAKTLLRLEINEMEHLSLRPWLSGITIATAYFFGGFIPLLPYLFASVGTAFMISVGITASVLFMFGCVKGSLAGAGQGVRKSFKSGLEMLLLGGLAAGAALLCVAAMNHYRSP